MAINRSRPEHRYAFSLFYRLIDLLIITTTLKFCAWFYGVDFNLHYLVLMLGAPLVFLYVSDVSGLYRSWRGEHYGRLLLNLGLTWSASLVILVTIAFLTKTSDLYSRVTLGFWFLLAGACLMAWRSLLFRFLHHIRRQGYNLKRAAVLGCNEQAQALRQQLSEHTELGIKLVGVFDERSEERVGEPLAGTFEQAIERAQSKDVDQVYVTLPLRAQHRLESLLAKLGDTTCDVFLIPDAYALNFVGARQHAVGELTSLSVFESPCLGIHGVIKRTMDIILSVLILAILTVPMLVVAGLVKATSPGPAIFRQTRYGLGGKPIKVWKFRTMRAMEDGGRVTQATKGDPRITPIGKFLRQYSVDELPQFINVLKGDMSIVGPRPHAVAHNEEYRRKVEYYMLRHKVKPGITGWAQINGWRGETDTLEKMEMRVQHDLEYMRLWSPWLDFKIILLTMFKGVSGENAY